MHEIERTAGKYVKIRNKMDAPGCAIEAGMWQIVDGQWQSPSHTTHW